MSPTTLGAAPAPRGRAERMLVVARMAGVVGVLWAVLTLALPVEAQRGVPAASRWPPPPLDMQVPFEPTAFPSAGRVHVTYELHIRNFAPNSVTLQRVEILDADTAGATPIAVFEADALESILQPVGAQPRAGPAGERRQLAGGGSVVLFLSAAFDRGARVPPALWHRVVTGDYTTEGAAIGTHHSELRVLGPPLRGTDWLVGSGPSNDSYHRRGLVVFDGRALIDRRYAIDWTQVEQGSTFSGDALDNRSYHAYGEEVLAVASGRVVWARDRIPENMPRHEGFRPAVAISLDTLAGNTVTLDVGGGQFAYYMHLQPGSLRVKTGDRVRRGQEIARIGNSGDSREPHLHLEVTDSSRFLAGEGVPYLIDWYRTKSADGAWQVRRRELPLKDMLVDFGSSGGGGK